MLAFVLLLCFGVIFSDKGRIYNGNLVSDDKQYPFMAALINENEDFDCTGNCQGMSTPPPSSPPLPLATILDEDTILTAAHCVEQEYDANATKFSVYLGHHDITKERRDKNYLYPVERFIRHEQYELSELEKGFDVAVIKLARKIKFEPRVQKVSLPELGISADFENCMVIGWGETNTTIPQHTKLSHVQVPIHPGDKCNAENDVRYVICSQDRAAGRGICFGDSGGPLICPLNSSTWLQFGITSFGGCGDESHFGRVAAYVDWIKDKTGPGIQVVEPLQPSKLKNKDDKTELSKILICAVSGVLLLLLVGVVIFKITKKAKDKHNLEAAKQENKAHGHAKRPRKSTGTETKTQIVTTPTSMENNSLNSRSKDSSATKTCQGRNASNRKKAKCSATSIATQTSRNP